MGIGLDNSAPIYLQLAQQIEKDIISGKLKSGERLASVRDLALQLKVNPNTLQKTLAELENKRLIFTERTNGKFVTADDGLIKKLRDEYANLLSQRYLDDMLDLGFDTQDAIQILKERR